MKHRHLVGQRWSLAAIDDALGEHGSLVNWRGLMRCVWVDPYGPIAAGVEKMLDAVKPHLAEPYEGRINQDTRGLWRDFLRDARAWIVEQFGREAQIAIRPSRSKGANAH